MLPHGTSAERGYRDSAQPPPPPLLLPAWCLPACLPAYFTHLLHHTPQPDRVPVGVGAAALLRAAEAPGPAAPAAAAGDLRAHVMAGGDGGYRRGTGGGGG